MASNGNTTFNVAMGPISTNRITRKSIVSSLTMKGACWTTILLVVKFFLFAWFLVGGGGRLNRRPPRWDHSELKLLSGTSELLAISAISGQQTRNLKFRHLCMSERMLHSCIFILLHFCKFPFSILMHYFLIRFQLLRWKKRKEN